MPWDNPRDTYRTGGFWRIDDRSGRKVRAWKTQKEVGGLIVRDADAPSQDDSRFQSKPHRFQKRLPAVEPADEFLDANDITGADL